MKRRLVRLYIRSNWALLGVTLGFTIMPVVMCLIFLMHYSSGVMPLDRWFSFYGIFDNEYHINNVLLSFIIVSYVLLFSNQFVYFLEAQSKAFNYRGTNTHFKYINVLCQFIDITVLVAIMVFILRVNGYHQIITYNRVLSLSVFLAFSITDALMWYQEYLIRRTLRDPLRIRLCNNNISFSRRSMLLINLPALIILLFSFYFHCWIKDDPFYHSYFDGAAFREIENFDLFIDGFETSIIFTSIIITQMVFAVLKITWSFTKFQIEHSISMPSATARSFKKPVGRSTKISGKVEV